MTFGNAIEKVKEGKKVARMGWNGKGMFIFDLFHSVLKLTEDTAFQEERYDCSELDGVIEIGLDETYKLENFVLLKTAVGACIPWKASQSDMLANDWLVIG